MPDTLKIIKSGLIKLKQCKRFPNIKDCVCYYNAFKVLEMEINKLEPVISAREKDEFNKLKKEIKEICGKFDVSPRKCFGCRECAAHYIFENLPEDLEELYLKGGV